jgi:hypothetical protein
MKILFFNNVEYGQLCLPEGIAILSAVLKEQGHKVKLFDTALLKPGLKTVASEEAVCAGISFYKRTSYSMSDLLSADLPVNRDESFRAVIESFKPSLIAVSAMTTNARESLCMIAQALQNIM